MKKFKLLTLFLITASLLYFTSCGKKETEVSTSRILEAKVTLVIGEAYLLREDNPERIAVKIGTRLKPSDVIITGKKSAVNVIISKRGIFKLKENSRVSFKDLLVVDDENNVTRLKVTAGKVVLGLKKLAKDSVFEVETPTAVAGVRGTSFLVSVKREDTSAFPYFVKVSKDKNIVTKIGVLAGKVEIINPQNPEQRYMVDTLKEATLIDDDFENIKIEKITRLTLDEIKAIKELSEIRQLKLKEISDEITSVEPEIEDIMKSDIGTKAEIKSAEEDLSKTESALEKEKIEMQKESIKKIKKPAKGTGKYLEDEEAW